MRKLRVIFSRYTGGGPVKLNTKPLGECSIVEILTLPRMAFGEMLHACGAKKKQQEGEHVVGPGIKIRIQDEHQAHQECEDVRDSKYKQCFLLIVNSQPVGDAEQVVNVFDARRQMLCVVCLE